MIHFKKNTNPEEKVYITKTGNCEFIITNSKNEKYDIIKFTEEINNQFTRLTEKDIKSLEKLFASIEYCHERLKIVDKVIKLLTKKIFGVSVRTAAKNKIEEIIITWRRNYKNINIIKCSYNIENLALGGGGSKGVLMIGALYELESKSIIRGIKEISGTSIGSIIGTMLACGMSAMDMYESIKTLDFESLLGPPTFLCFDRTGQPLENTIKEILLTHVKLKINLLKLNKKQTNVNLENIENEITKKGITFKTLSELHSLYPEEFKNIKITVVDADSNDGTEVKYCSKDSTPELPVWVACRASASLPIMLLPKRITYGNEEIRCVDGGLLKNIPADIFVDPNKTLAIMFNEETSDREMHNRLNYKPLTSLEEMLPRRSTIVIEKILIDFFAKWWNNIKTQKSYVTEERTNIINTVENYKTIVLSTNLGTTEFLKANKKFFSYFNYGMKQAKKILKMGFQIFVPPIQKSSLNHCEETI